MFGRQWFDKSTQAGLCSESLVFEQYLCNHDFQSAYDTAINSYQSNVAYWGRQIRRLFHLSNHCERLKQDKSYPLTIYFDSFWPDMNPGNCQLLDLLRAALPERSVYVANSLSQDVDIIFGSCYGNSLSQCPNNTAKRILFLGENIRPYFSDYDYSISSDLDSYCGRNIYLPLWMLELDWFSKSYPDRKTYKIDQFISGFIQPSLPCTNDVVFVGNNWEPYRQAVFTELNQLGVNVQIYGSQYRPVGDKVELYKRYKVVFCPENTCANGYITEKVLHGYLSGSYFSYRGDRTLNGFNPVNTMLNINDMSSYQTANLLASFVSRSKPQNIEPLFSRTNLFQRFTALLNDLRKILIEYRVTS